jgi:hypothetical protein
MLKISGSPFIFGSLKIGLDFLCNWELAIGYGDADNKCD